MGKIIEVISGYVTAPSTTFTGLTMNGQDSKTIRFFPSQAKCFLLDAASFSQGTGQFRVAAPGMHDATNGIRMQHTSADPSPLIPQGRYFQEFTPQQVLTLEATGSATGGDIEQHGLVLYYEDVQGMNARLIDEATLGMAIDSLQGIIGVQVSLTAGTAGGYSGTAAINATVDNLIANRDYAVLGGETTVAQGFITLRGADFGNVRVGFPGAVAKKDVTRDYFVSLSRKTGLPTIPVLNSANKGGIFVETLNNENAASPVVTIYLALLKPGYVA